MTQWNKMQEKAIYTKHKNILVSASAGSGKTTVLIARLLHLVQDERIEIKRILAMTFTEAAANEMKKRMAKELGSALERSQDVEERAYLNTQLANLSSSYISTIHGFCLQIIQDYYYVINLNKARVSNVMDSSQSVDIMTQSMDSVFAHFLTHPHFTSLCMAFSGRAHAHDTLKEKIISLFYLAQAKSDPISFLAQCKSGDTYTCIQDYPAPVRAYFFDHLHVQCESIKDALSQFRMSASLCLTPEKMEVVEAKQALVAQAYTYIEAQDYTQFKEAIIAASTCVLPTVKDNEELKLCKKECEGLEKKLHEILFDESQFVSFTQENAPLVNVFVDAVTHFLSTYTTLKEAANALDFSDMEHFALRILQANNGMVATLYRSHFAEIMVDEFQDSNDVQDQLVRLICTPNNVFRVGDIKQSIYGFRHATPAIMRTLIQHKGAQDEVIYLNSNYRSKQSIVDFNNALFDTLMNIDGFSSSFTKDDYTTCGLPSQCENNTPIRVCLLDDKSINQERYHALSSDDIKATYIAQTIQTMVTQGYSYRDFAVLIKTNAKSEPLRAAFDALHIPCFANRKEGFYDSPAVALIITFIKALYTPHDDISFVALALSPFLQMSDDELAQARLSMKPYQHFYDYFKGDERIEAWDALRARLHDVSLSQTIRDIFMLNDYYETCITPQEQSNLDKLYDIVCSYEDRQYVSVAQFLAIIEQSKNAQVGEAIPIGNEDDVVRIMSIHQSKGLQFPVVFLFSTSTMNIMDTQGLIGFDEEVKVAMNHLQHPYRSVYPTIERIALNHKRTKESLEEDMRVLYVATTRAQSEMYIVDCGRAQERSALNKIELYKKKGFTALLTQAMAHMPVGISYEELYIERLEESIPDTMHTQPLQALPRYAYESQAHVVQSPSEHEVLQFRPRPLSLDEDDAMERGRRLHAMVEHMPPSVWSLELLTSYASKLQIPLRNHDFNVLLQLSTQPQFQSISQGQVHHELPFMVKEGTSITHGYMDYVSIHKDVVYMIDFKSDRGVDVDTLIQRYKGQIDAYTKALTLMYPQHRIQSYIYSFEDSLFIEMK